MSIPAPPRPDYAHDPLIDELTALPYWEVRKFMWHRVKPRYPRFIYKYRNFDPTSQDSVQHLRDLVVESKFWLSSPRDFNDPFDMTAHVVLEGTATDLRGKWKELIKRFGSKEGSNWKQQRRKLDEVMGKGRDQLLELVSRSHSSNAERTGIFSFAGDPRSILMWSYYAKDHAGVCLQFEFAKDPKILLSAVSVRYTDVYPEFDWARDTQKQIAKTMLNKHSGWRYEREFRIVYPAGAHTMLAFSPNALVGIIFGCRISSDTLNAVRDLLKERASKNHPGVRLYKAEKHLSRYQLVIKRLPESG